jgi:hypothetical protein
VDQVAPVFIGSVYDDGLQDAVLADVFSQLLELGIAKFGARVAAVFVQQMDRYPRRSARGINVRDRCTVSLPR